MLVSFTSLQMGTGPSLARSFTHSFIKYLLSCQLLRCQASGETGDTRVNTVPVLTEHMLWNRRWAASPPICMGHISFVEKIMGLESDGGGGSHDTLHGQTGKFSQGM